MSGNGWSDGDRWMGAWLSIPDSFSAELIASQGFDYVCVDNQHGLGGQETMVESIRAIQGRGTRAFVRVSANDQAEIMRALDAGAQGVVVPMVNSSAEAAHAVAAFRYPPDGLRSYGPTRTRLINGTGVPAELQKVLCLVQVETVAGFDALEEIAGTPGVDGIYIGPSDLAVCFGEDPTQPGCHDTMSDRIDLIRAACRRAGIAVGIHCLEGVVAKRYIERDFDLITTIVDSTLLARAAAGELAAAKAKA